MPTRFSALNMVLLLVTIISLMFGTWSFIANEEDAGNAISHSRSDADSSIDDDDDESIGRPNNNADNENPGETVRRPKNVNANKHNKTTNNNSSLNDEVVASNKSDPSDSGDAAITGRVMTADGDHVGGALVTARRSDLTLTPPTFAGGNIEEFRAKVAAFLSRANKESRTTTTNDEGVFSFVGLDGTRSYNISVSTELHGSGNADRVAAGDSVTVMLKGTQLLIGTVQTEDGKPITEFTVKVWKPNQT
ncbi:MAG: hypothetical protein ACYTDT_07455, partial [Planctomycetota bacterium]